MTLFSLDLKKAFQPCADLRKILVPPEQRRRANTDGIILTETLAYFTRCVISSGRGQRVWRYAGVE